MIVTPLSVTAVAERALQRRRAAIERQQARMHVQKAERRQLEDRPGHDLAVRGEREEVGLRRLRAPRRRRASRCGSSVGDAPARAPPPSPASGASLCPRPLGRSGCVTTRRTSLDAASARRDGTANSLVPKKTVRSTRGALRREGRPRSRAGAAAASRSAACASASASTSASAACSSFVAAGRMFRALSV